MANFEQRSWLHCNERSLLYWEWTPKKAVTLLNMVEGGGGQKAPPLLVFPL